LALAKGLQARGHQPTVIAAVFDDEPPQTEVIERRIWDGVPVISVDKNKVREQGVRDTYDHAAMAGIHELILRELKPDIVHVCHLINHTVVLLDVLRSLRIPVVATLTDFFGICFTNKLETADGSLCTGPDPARVNCLNCFLKSAARPSAPLIARIAGSKRLRSRLARALAPIAHWRGGSMSIFDFRPADIVDRPHRLLQAMAVYRAAIAPTDHLRLRYQANGLRVPMVISHFGIDIDRRSKPPRARSLPVRIGFIGQIAPHKGVHILVRALRAAGRANLSAQIYGDSGQDPGYARTLKAESEGLALTFPGTFPADQVTDVLRNIDVLVMPATWYENSPLILLQALSTHTPVIVSDVPGLTEFVTDGLNGLIVARDDVLALAAALRRIADSDALLDKLTQGAQWSRTVSDMVDDVITVYCNALTLPTNARID
jgi:glycosyltransferase involved in cell wall biosynthesis